MIVGGISGVKKMMIPVGLTALLTNAAVGTVLTDFNSGSVVADFLFDDVNGTSIESTVNSANGSLTWDTDLDMGGATTNGSGQFDGSGKANTEFASVYVDVATITTGRVIALFEVSWDFNQTIYNPAEDEEFRLSLITFDPRSTFVTTEIYFQRTSAEQVTLFGNAVGTGASDTPNVVFGASGSLLTLFDVDLDADTAELFYSSDSGASFTSAGSAALDPGRGVDSLRLVLNEDFGDDTLLIERVALSVVPEPSALMLVLTGLLPLLNRRRSA